MQIFRLSPPEDETFAQKLIKVTQFFISLLLFPKSYKASGFYLLQLENYSNFKTLPYFPKSFALLLPYLSSSASELSSKQRSPGRRILRWTWFPWNQYSSILIRSVKKLTDRLEPEKFRQTKDNLKDLFSVCCENLDVLFVFDIEKGKVFSVRAAHYWAPDVKTALKGLSNPIALSFHEGILYVPQCLQCSKNRIS